MIIMQGKYNTATVFVDSFDEATAAQIQLMLNHPAMADSQIRIMSDCHAGTGSVIGFTMTRNKTVIPNLIGVDIGCRVFAINLGKDRQIDLERFDDFVVDTVPAGPVGHNGNDHLAFMTNAEKNNLKAAEACLFAEIPMGDYWSKLGTMGSGNHFIELDKAPDDNIWLVIHSGSRHFGNLVAKWHQEQAKRIAPGYPDMEFLAEDAAEMYISDMKHAQLYAQVNVRTMARIILCGYFGMPMHAIEHLDIIESVHNYIDFDDNIIRKGAIRSHRDERVIIPMNRAFGCVIGTGKSAINYNLSAPHGAGRILSRSQAKKRLSIEKLKADMAGIYTSTADKSTLDEAPDAYKNPASILKYIHETVNVDYIMKPIYSFKDSKRDSMGD